MAAALAGGGQRVARNDRSACGSQGPAAGGGVACESSWPAGVRDVAPETAGVAENRVRSTLRSLPKRVLLAVSGLALTGALAEAPAGV
jgi:hypothetical protein